MGVDNGFETPQVREPEAAHPALSFDQREGVEVGSLCGSTLVIDRTKVSPIDFELFTGHGLLAPKAVEVVTSPRGCLETSAQDWRKGILSQEHSAT